MADDDSLIVSLPPTTTANREHSKESKRMLMLKNFHPPKNSNSSIVTPKHLNFKKTRTAERKKSAIKEQHDNVLARQNSSEMRHAGCDSDDKRLVVGQDNSK